MTVNLRQGQLRDHLVQVLETAVLGDPSLDFREQILGDIDRAGLSVLLAGEVMAGMARPLLAMAAGPTALFVNGDEAGGQDRTAGLEFFGAGQEVAGDQGGMFGYFHEVGKRGKGLA